MDSTGHYSFLFITLALQGTCLYYLFNAQKFTRYFMHLFRTILDRKQNSQAIYMNLNISKSLVLQNKPYECKKKNKIQEKPLANAKSRIQQFSLRFDT
jgi:hypothetical protein